jgi:hypothetical protein
MPSLVMAFLTAIASGGFSSPLVLLRDTLTKDSAVLVIAGELDQTKSNRYVRLSEKLESNEQWLHIQLVFKGKDSPFELSF